MFTIVMYLRMLLALYQSVGSLRSGVKSNYLCRNEGLSNHLWTMPGMLPDTLCPGFSNRGVYTGSGQGMQACQTKPMLMGLPARQTFVCSSTHIPVDGNSHLPSFKDSAPATTVVGSFGPGLCCPQAVILGTARGRGERKGAVIINRRINLGGTPGAEG